MGFAWMEVLCSTKRVQNRGLTTAYASPIFSCVAIRFLFHRISFLSHYWHHLNKYMRAQLFTMLQTQLETESSKAWMPILSHFCKDFALENFHAQREKALMLPGVVARSFVVYFFELSLRGDPWRQGELPLKYWVLLLKIQPAQQSYQSLKVMWP
ncbi:hypothetical protein VNO77_34539 [Canavalia gladiata]|uniref:Uncharacterized protein n=1 Tax=Canavalia gladiata TaxID=3824 RepID=A0AAN9KDS5_CANGL